MSKCPNLHEIHQPHPSERVPDAGRSPKKTKPGFFFKAGLLAACLTLNVTVLSTTAEEKPAATKELSWLESMAKGYTTSQRTREPILVLAQSVSCPYCRQLEEEIRKPAVQQELKRWVRVTIDVDKSPSDAGLLEVSATPGLRLLTANGKIVAAHNGKIEAEKLVEWLQQHFTDAAGTVPKALENEGPLEPIEVIRIVRELQNRDATVREAAIRRLMPHLDLAAPTVVSSFESGNLATRLASLELLTEWKAPIDGLDPWQPKSLTKERVKKLTDWVSTSAQSRPAEEKPKTELTADELKSARDMMAKLIEASPVEAPAIRERLARFGKLLLPEVYAQLPKAQTDTARERLTELRYRLVATENLVLTWSGGLSRLAATDVKTREEAAAELAKRALAPDEPLLLELFSDPAPLVREISLRALRAIGGSNSGSALVRLLHDPDPNVRAAVLKQVAEAPSSTITEAIAKYIANEKDPDLIVHAVRVLKNSGNKAAVEALLKLFKHSSWRVRAEAAEAVGEASGDRYGRSKLGDDAASLRADVLTALIEQLKDDDSFVVGRSVGALKYSDLKIAVGALAQAAEDHPELAGEVVKVLSERGKGTPAVIEHLRKFCKHTVPQVRAAAIGGLCHVDPKDSKDHLIAALSDSEEVVRTAAANAFFELLATNKNVDSAYPTSEASIIVEEATNSDLETPSLIGGFIKSLFGGNNSAKPGKKPAATKTRIKGKTTIVDGETGNVIETIETTESNDTADWKDPVDPSLADNDKPVVAERPSSSELTNEKGLEAEERLRQIRSGKVHESWQFALADNLRSMLKSNAAPERMAVARCLAALGQDSDAIPVITACLESAPAQFLHPAAEVFPWLLWTDRERLFHRMVELAQAPDQLQTAAHYMASTSDSRFAPLLWDLLARNEAREALADVVLEALKRLYFADHSYQPEQATSSQRRAAISNALPKAREGTPWQRMVALTLTMQIAFDDASKIARAIVDDPAQDAKFRSHVFQLLLMHQQTGEATKSALAGIKSEHEDIRAISLRYLAGDMQSLWSLPGGHFTVGRSNMELSSNRGSEVTLPEAPNGLTVEMLKPFADSNDPELAADAAYLLALLNDSTQLERLIEQWRKQPDNDNLQKFVYRAVAVLDDSTRLPVLQSMYEQMRKAESSTHEIREFYWTIRSMTGPDALALRKRMRDEVGMDQLR